MPSTLNLIYHLLHKDYPENFSAYIPQTKDFYDMVHSQLPENWSIQRGDMWFYCSPPFYQIPLQGWTIHISATSGNCREILDSIASVLIKYDDASFKFALDRSRLSLLNSKNSPMMASRKFITIYPADSHRFFKLIEEVHQATIGMQGPCIFSDYRYRNSQVVFYRYNDVRTHTALSKKSHASSV